MPEPKVAIVVQRYGEEVIGGAETHARQIAEHLVSDLGWQVEVFTSCALEYRYWRNHYPQGSSQLKGVKVHRFAVQMQRAHLLFGVLRRLLSFYVKYINRSTRFTRFLENLCFKWQGPYCPELSQSIRANSESFERIFFFTYLYYPTVNNLLALKEKAVLIPLAHDEPLFYFPLVKEILEKAPILLCNSEFEKDLILKKMQIDPEKIQIAGMGMKGLEEKIPQLAAEPLPYLLYLGRIGFAKGVENLIADFIWQDAQNDGKVSLYLAGAIEDGFVIPTHPRIHYLGFLEDKVKFSYLKGALALVSPSELESLSLVFLEALSMERPALLTAKNPLFVRYAKDIPGVYSYANRKDFSDAILSFLSPESPAMLAQNLVTAREWVYAHYSWPRVLSAYSACVKLKS